jgi:hypothetical protein
VTYARFLIIGIYFAHVLFPRYSFLLFAQHTPAMLQLLVVESAQQRIRNNAAFHAFSKF